MEDECPSLALDKEPWIERRTGVYAGGSWIMESSIIEIYVRLNKVSPVKTKKSWYTSR